MNTPDGRGMAWPDAPGPDDSCRPLQGSPSWNTAPSAAGQLRCLVVDAISPTVTSQLVVFEIVPTTRPTDWMAAVAWSTVSPTTLGTLTLRSQVISVTWDPISAWLVTIGLVATTRFWLDGSQAVVVVSAQPGGGQDGPGRADGAAEDVVHGDVLDSAQAGQVADPGARLAEVLLRGDRAGTAGNARVDRDR
jgi:hypothetical protein